MSFDLVAIDPLRNAKVAPPDTEGGAVSIYVPVLLHGRGRPLQ
jgi:hypothetical protein